jgi:ABC-type nitrate/sulfonate/bicarbonate transport system substrate-binding protein
MRIKYCTAILIVFLLFHPTPAISADGTKLQKLVIGYAAPVASLAMIDVMKKGGLLRKHGLEVELVFIPGSGVLTAAMVSGQVPLTFLAGAASHVIAAAIPRKPTAVTAPLVSMPSSWSLEPGFARAITWIEPPPMSLLQSEFLPKNTCRSN